MGNNNELKNKIQAVKFKYLRKVKGITRWDNWKCISGRGISNRINTEKLLLSTVHREKTTEMAEVKSSGYKEERERPKMWGTLIIKIKKTWKEVRDL